MGAVWTLDGDRLCIDTEHLAYSTPDPRLTSRIRASSYLLGSCLARFGRADLLSVGGCSFSDRPIDMHIGAAVTLGARLENGEIIAKKLHGSDIIFEKTSVGATINAILMATVAEGRSRIYGYAKEPHVLSLIDFLNSAGACIRPHARYIEIEGRTLHGASGAVIPDMIEAGTYLSLSLATRSPLRIIGARLTDLDSFITTLVDAGACISFSGDTVSADGALDTPAAITAAPHPAFATDLQPQTAPMLATFCGGSITDTVWPLRFGYLTELSKHGLEYERRGNVAHIKPSHLRSAHTVAPDLRGGAALLIAALVANGESRIDSAEIIKRGYENVIKKLRGVGADIYEI
jgi:UDP-N-acetylglucosamine 1-carboxyvinyltransferase